MNLDLELVDLVLGVAEVLQGAGQVALVLGADLVAGDGLHHARGAANEDLDVLVLGLGEDSLEEVLGDVAAVADPLLGGVVEDVEGTEALGVGVLEVLELRLEQDVLVADVAVDDCYLGLVVGVVKDGAAELVHGGNASTAGNKGDVVVLVLGPGVLGERALDVQALANSHVVEVVAHGAIGVALDQEIHVAALI